MPVDLPDGMMVPHSMIMEPERRIAPARKSTVWALYFFKISQAAHTTTSAVNSKFIVCSFHKTKDIENMISCLFYYNCNR